jgi:hypothetical protein
MEADDDELLFHIEGCDQAFVTQRARNLLEEKLAPFRFVMVGNIVDATEVHDIYGHAFHCCNEDGKDVIVFHFTAHLSFTIHLYEGTYHGLLEIKNIRSSSKSHIEPSISRWDNSKAPKGTTLNQANAIVSSCKMRNYLAGVVVTYKSELEKLLIH